MYVALSREETGPYSNRAQQQAILFSTLTIQPSKSKHSFLVYNMIPCSWCFKFPQLVKKLLSAIQNASSH